MNIENIDNKLSVSELDSVVGIKHALVVKGIVEGYHIAEISKQVQAHVHMHGDEFYHILSGEGLIYLGKSIFEENKPVKIDWEPPKKVKLNDVFIIPQGYAHSLKNIGGKPLVIGFVCPHTHLENDRHIVDNPK